MSSCTAAVSVNYVLQILMYILLSFLLEKIVILGLQTCGLRCFDTSSRWQMGPSVCMKCGSSVIIAKVNVCSVIIANPPFYYISINQLINLKMAELPPVDWSRWLYNLVTRGAPEVTMRMQQTSRNCPVDRVRTWEYLPGPNTLPRQQPTRLSPWQRMDSHSVEGHGHGMCRAECMLLLQPKQEYNVKRPSEKSDGIYLFSLINHI
jgi:hypothetical protein